MRRYFQEIDIPGQRLARRCGVSHSQIYMARTRNVGPGNAEKISRGMAAILGLPELDRLHPKAENMGYPGVGVDEENLREPGAARRRSDRRSTGASESARSALLRVFWGRRQGCRKTIWGPREGAKIRPAKTFEKNLRISD
jgi:hypothetical protein